MPHIRAQNLEGALWGMGYCHARDRGMQMLLMRIVGQGRGSELLAANDEMLETDRFFRRMGWVGGIAAQLDILDEPTTRLCRSYCDGVDARLLQYPPLELRLMGIEPEPWSVADCILFSRMMGYVTLAQSQAEAERLFVEMVQAGVDDERLRALFPGIEELREGKGFDRAMIERVRLGERIVPSSLRWLSAVPRMMASNNWVVAPSRSASGHALFANDPHLETNRLPNVWCEQAFVITGSPSRRLCCATVPGLPTPTIGRSQDLAWGATYAFMDSVDSWVEDCRDGRYRRGDAWEEFGVRRERILRKGKEPVEMTLYVNEHGVLDGDPHQEGYYLCTRWAGADSGARTLMGSSGMWTARTVAEGREHLGGIETAWSWVLADRDGSIGLQMSGRLPRRAPGISGFVPRAGWDRANDWQGFVSPEELPRAINPVEGYLVTANHDLNHLGAVKAITMPMGNYRARRIESLLEQMPSATVEDMKRIQLDVWSQQAAELMEVLGPLLPNTEAGRLLAQWDLRYTTDSRAATLFEIFYRELRREVFGRGGLGDAVLGYLLGETGIFNDFYQNFDRVLLAESSPWHDGRTRDEIFARAFEVAAEQPPVPWGERNRLTLTHLLLGGRLPRWLGFDHGPIPMPGGRATPRQGQVYRSGGRVTSFTPSLRLVACLGEEGMHTAMAGGPSDRRWSRWYTSAIEDWRHGRYSLLHPED